MAFLRGKDYNWDRGNRTHIPIGTEEILSIKKSLKKKRSIITLRS